MKGIETWPRVTVSAAALLVALTACTGGEPTQEEVVVEVAASIQDVGTVDAPAAEASPAWAYDPIGKRDPYRAYSDIIEPPSQELSELQRWELDQLRVVGILKKNGDRMAMVEDPKGKGHIVQQGDFIGKRWGRVERIAVAEIVVAETYEDEYGRRIPIEVSMELPQAYPEG